MVSCVVSAHCFVHPRFREEDLAPKKKDDKKAERRQQKRQEEAQARRLQEKEAIEAAVADSKEGPEDESKPAQKENVGKKRKLAKDDGLRVPSTKAWHEGEAHQGPIKVRGVFPRDRHRLEYKFVFAMLCNQSYDVQC